MHPRPSLVAARPPQLPILLVLLALLPPACASSDRSQIDQMQELTRAVTPPSRLEPPAYLPGTARALLRTRMAAHARDMGDLASAIMVLAYDRIEEQSEAVAADASWARPLTGDATELNSALPERFFLLQDDLRAQARVLSSAARSRSAFAVASAYGALSETCVKCHAVYREGHEPPSR